jgi:hypothetical protein
MMMPAVVIVLSLHLKIDGNNYLWTNTDVTSPQTTCSIFIHKQNIGSLPPYYDQDQDTKTSLSPIIYNKELMNSEIQDKVIWFSVYLTVLLCYSTAWPSLNYSLWLKDLLQQAIVEIRNDSDSEVCTAIPDIHNFSECFQFSGMRVVQGWPGLQYFTKRIRMPGSAKSHSILRYCHI